MDTDGDGSGDISGIIEKLDYIKGGEDSLGVDAIWLSPFYTSPMIDGGYDVSDYCGVNPLFGTLADFKRLLDEAHRRQIRVMIDFVPSHTSDIHPWFEQSASSRESSQRDWYIWRDAKPDGSAPNNWLSVAGGSAWQYDEKTDQYYLHSFLKEQPDLNWDNLEVREAMKAVVDFWLSMGVDGLRADAVRWMAKDRSFIDNLPNPNYQAGQEDPYHSQIHTYEGSADQLRTYLCDIAAAVERYDDCILIFEDYPNFSGVTLEERYRPYLELYDINPRVAMPFNFEGMFTAFHATSFRDFVGTIQSLLTDDRIPVYCFGNHDQSRLVSRFGQQQARLIAMMQLTLPGLPVMYYGDELGMSDGRIDDEFIQDSFEKNNPGVGIGRDPERTPMQWSHGLSAGFSKGVPWLPLPSELQDKTVADQQTDRTSFFALYQKILALRSSTSTLRRGAYETFGTNDEHIFSYKRSDKDYIFTIALNFSDQTVECYIGESNSDIIAATSQPVRMKDEHTVNLRPYQGIVMARRV
ncbi:alpha-amylase [Candidatus Saccharibacteria bacterium]|nr:alpha-amylase [Candidatus Saccharibacteria bacterium]